MPVETVADDFPPVPRIPPLPREQWTDAAREVFAFWGEPGSWENGSATTTMNTFAQHPGMAMAHANFGKQLLMDSDITVRERELAVLRVAWRTRSAYEWHYHVGYGLNGGMTLEEIGAIREPLDAHPWSELDRAILSAVDELFERSRVSDETWATLAKRFDTKPLMELIYTIGNYVMTAWVIAAFGIQVEDWADAIGFDLKTKSGGAPRSRLKPGETDDWHAQNGARVPGAD